MQELKGKDLLALKALVNAANANWSIGWPITYARDGYHGRYGEPTEGVFQHVVDNYLYDTDLERYRFYKNSNLTNDKDDDRCWWACRHGKDVTAEFRKHPALHCLIYMLLRDQYDCWGKWKHQGGPITRRFLKKLRGAEQAQRRRFKGTEYEEFINSLKEHKWPKRHIKYNEWVNHYPLDDEEEN